jgi:hypothetical protein
MTVLMVNELGTYIIPTPVPIFIKLVRAPEPVSMAYMPSETISKAYFINESHQ